MVPYYTDAFTKFGIISHFDFYSYKYNYGIITNITTPRFLIFQSKEIAQEFLNNFRDLIEQASDLLWKSKTLIGIKLWIMLS